MGRHGPALRFTLAAKTGAGAVGESPAAQPVYVGAPTSKTGAAEIVSLGPVRDGLRACPSHRPDWGGGGSQLRGLPAAIGAGPVDAVAGRGGVAGGYAGADSTLRDARRSSVALPASADAEVVRWRGAYQERAPVIEFDAGLARADAAAAAYADVLGLWLEEHPDTSERAFMVMLARACDESEVVFTRAEFRP
jgi:hypothetical protein